MCASLISRFCVQVDICTLIRETFRQWTCSSNTCLSSSNKCTLGICLSRSITHKFTLRQDEWANILSKDACQGLRDVSLRLRLVIYTRTLPRSTLRYTKVSLAVFVAAKRRRKAHKDERMAEEGGGGEGNKRRSTTEQESWSLSGESDWRRYLAMAPAQGQALESYKSCFSIIGEAN